MKTLFVLCGLLVQSMLFACGGINQQVYSGKIEYSLDPANPFSCTAVITLDFDINELLVNDSIWVNWGDGFVTAVHGTGITEDTVASTNMGTTKIYTHVYSSNHIYTALPAGGYYNITFQNEYRLNGIANIESGDGVNLNLCLVAQVSIDTAAAQSQPLAFPPLTIGFTNFASYTQNGLLQYNGNGDSVSYSFTTPLAAINSPVPLYQLPDQFCIANGSNSSFTIDSLTGSVLWADPCYQGIYSFGTLLSQYRNGQLISSIMREQNIYVTATYNGIQTIAYGNSLQIYPNPAQNTLSGTINIAVPGAEDMLEIIAADGTVVARNIPVKTGKFETDISRLAAGVYLLQFKNAGEVLTQKFVKQ